MVVNITSAQCSASNDAIKTTTYDADAVVRGNAFLVERNFAIESGATLNLVYDYTGYTPAPGEIGVIYVLPPTYATTSGPVIVNVYRGTNYSGGSQLKFINPKTTATKTESGTTIIVGATGSTKGTLTMEYLVGGKSQGSNAASGTFTGLEFFIRGNTGKTLIEIANQSGEAITFHNGQVIFEI